MEKANWIEARRQQTTEELLARLEFYRNGKRGRMLTRGRRPSRRLMIAAIQVALINRATAA